MAIQPRLDLNIPEPPTREDRLRRIFETVATRFNGDFLAYYNAVVPKPTVPTDEKVRNERLASILWERLRSQGG